MATITHSFKGEPDDLLQALDDINKASKKTDDEVKKIGDDTEKTTKKGSAGFKNFAGAMGVAAGAALALAAGIAKVVAETLDLSVQLNKIDKGAKAVGVTNAEFQILEGTLGRVTDGSLKTVNVMADLNKRLGKAAEGAGPAYEALNKLGLSAEELSKLDTPEQLAVIGDEIAKLGTQAEKSKVQSDLFGGAGKALGAAFANGGADIRAAAAEVERIGLVSDEAVNQAAALQDAQDGLSQAFLVLKTDVLAPLMPVLTDASIRIGDIISEASKNGELEAFGNILKDIGESGVVDILIDLVDIMTSLAPVAEVLGFILERMWIVPFKAAEALIALISGDGTGALNALKDVVESLSFGLIDFADDTDDATEAQEGLKDAINETSDAALDAIIAEGFFGDQLAKTKAIRAELIKTLREQKFAQKELNVAQKEAIALTKTWTEETTGATKGSEDLTGGIDGTTSSVRGLGEGIDEVQSQNFGSDIETFTEKFTKFQEGLEEIVEPLLVYGELATSIFDAIGDSQQRQLDNWVDEYDSATDKIESIDEQLAGTLSDSRRAALREQKANLVEEKSMAKEKALQAFEANKATAIANAVINTALAVITGLTAQPWQLGIALAAAAGVAGAASIATIAAEPAPSFHTGGMLDGITDNLAPDEGIFRGRKDEAVLTGQGVAALGGSRAVDELNRGVSGSKQPIVVMTQWGNKTMNVATTENLSRKSGPLYEAIRKGQPRVGRYSPSKV